MGEPASCAGLERGSQEYERLKEERSQVLWRAVEEVIPDIRKRTEVEMVGQTPLLTVCSSILCSTESHKPWADLSGSLSHGKLFEKG